MTLTYPELTRVMRESDLARIDRLNLAREFAFTLARTNSNFDHLRFLEDCGL